MAEYPVGDGRSVTNASVKILNEMYGAKEQADFMRAWEGEAKVDVCTWNKWNLCTRWNTLNLLHTGEYTGCKRLEQSWRCWHMYSEMTGWFTLKHKGRRNSCVSVRVWNDQQSLMNVLAQCAWFKTRKVD